MANNDKEQSKQQHRTVGRPMSGFIGFLREHAVVSLAIGFVLGTQVQTVVKQLISSFIDPLFQLLLPGNKALSARTFTLHFNGRHANFGWGALAYDTLDFLFVALAVYMIIKLFRLDKLDKKEGT
jgi:large-conductance mechanosensitive channel